MTLSKERLEEIAELARKANYKPCAVHMTNLIAVCDSEVIEEMARRLLAAEAQEPVYQVLGEGTWTDYSETQLQELLKEKPSTLFRIAYAAPQPVAVPDELYKIASHIASAKGGLPDEWQDWAEEIETDIRRAALLNTEPVSQPYTLPDGWKLVPVEPTAEMYDAGDQQLATKQVWDAMLAAAPQEPTK